MPTYLSLNYHLIFSTKSRVPWIQPEWQPRLHAYLGGTVRGLGGVAMAVGGVEDHVHLLVGLRATHCLSDFIRELKKESSSWVKDEFHAKFAWQEGYAAVTVGIDGIERTRAYIANQERHHRNIGSLEELLAICREHNIEFDRMFVE